ncbi:MAG: arginine--tRNA ligase [Legionellales bacterium]|nr:arginine--tRNA ligase [Legionellales bacterium]
MKQQLQALLQQSIHALIEQGQLPSDLTIDPQVERARQQQHGDFASNVALVLAKTVQRNPRELAQLIIDQLPTAPQVTQVTLAGPGFINFTLSNATKYDVIQQVLTQPNYGQATIGQDKRVLLEYVSANPTGPLHVGHGRSAAYGASLANLLQAAGYQVEREYYVNDAGRQMQILAVSIWLRYLALLGEDITFPNRGYRGNYVVDIAQQLIDQYQQRFHCATQTVLAGLPTDGEGEAAEAHIDALIEHARQQLGDAHYHLIFQAGLNTLCEDIREDLAEFGVVYDTWFHEQTLIDADQVTQAIDQLIATDHTYRKDGALWFNATTFGDEKDRVLIRANGQTTYFASDVAYHWHKLQRHYDLIIDIFGADHHGYVPRLQAVMNALQAPVNILTVKLVQFAILYRGQQKVSMSTRSGEFVTLRQLRQEVGSDAARFFYVMRKAEQHMDFDLELAKSQSNDNPMYYIQYAHARICSVFRQLAAQQLSWNRSEGFEYLSQLTTEHEATLIQHLARYPEVIVTASEQLEPHQVAHFLRDCAQAFHTYYNAEQFITSDVTLRNARLNLIAAVKQVLAHGLQLLGVHAPEQM